MELNNSIFFLIVYGILIPIDGKSTLKWQNGNKIDDSKDDSMDFQCDNGEYISKLSLCDGQADCLDESDELPSQCYESGLRCPPSLFRCSYGACIPKSAVCNGIKDCNDNSDESLIECACRDLEFRCMDGSCVPESALCNGIKDCPDNSDEILDDCYQSSNKCSQDEFECAIGQCISKTKLCNGYPNCQDSSDETIFACSSTLCSPLSFRCTYGACIPQDAVCNGVQDCLDNSDELGTVCLKSSPKSEKFCQPPPQPENGLWRMHRSQCGFKFEDHCNVTVGVQFNRRARLVYSCNQGFYLDGPTDVVCNSHGEWSEIPRCLETRCDNLRFVDVRCLYKDQDLSCDLPSLPGTKAILGVEFVCNEDGLWELLE